jgi:hypothetical protein
MRRMRALVAALLAMWMSVSWAGLGSTPANLGGRVLAGVAGRAPYTEIENKLESGTVVHEYVDANGTVFAVSWSGPFLPDLKEILDSHFDAMAAHAGKAAKAGRSQLELRRSDLVIVWGGHMGAFEGRAWLPPKLPAGFSPSDIK